jgi:Domain of unknown function (DUF202)
MPSDASDADARDRTALSWERSAIALGLLAALFLPAADHRPWPALAAAGMMAIAAIAVFVFGLRLARRRVPAATRVVPEWAAVRALTAITLLSVLLATLVTVAQA